MLGMRARTSGLDQGGQRRVLDVGVGAAFLAGMLSFLSACVLPIVPPYLCYLAGIGFEQLQDDRIQPDITRRMLVTALFFVLGFTTVFVALGATASLIGQAIARHFDTLAVMAGILIIAMGLHFLGLLRIGLLQREVRVQTAAKPEGLVGAYLMGLALRRSDSGRDPVRCRR
jgi:cytochrome c-type biogenesis protein